MVSLGGRTIPIDIIDGSRRNVTEAEIRAVVEASKMGEALHSSKSKKSNARRVRPAKYQCVLCLTGVRVGGDEEVADFTTSERMKS